VDAQPEDRGVTALDRLELVPDQVELLMHDGNITRRPVSHFLDFVVNGKSLIRLLKGGGNYVTNLNRVWVPAVIPKHVAVMLGQEQDPDLEPGRVPLMVCAMDGDIGCGAVTAALSLTPATVTWSDFRWEDGSEPFDVPDGLPDPVTFERRQYEQEFAQAAARVSELPYDEAEDSRRGFLWPWQWGWRPPRDE
jgi:hypothetical protein